MNFSGKIFNETIYQKEYKPVSSKQISGLGDATIMEHPITKHKVIAKSFDFQTKDELKIFYADILNKQQN